MPFPSLARPLRVLLSINLAVFLVAWLAAFLRWPLLSWVVFIPDRWPEVWRWVTYSFVHVAPMHLFFNMLMLWMFGNDVATWLGGRTFVALYLFSGIAAALLALPFYLLELLSPQVYILGASGALFGVLVAFSRLFPDRVLLIFFLFPMPVRYAIWVFIGIDLFLVASPDGIAHLVHLGGAAAGFLFCAWRERGWGDFFHGRFGRRQGSKIRVGFLQGDSPDARLDAILGKIARSGMASLSPKELAFLQEVGEQRKARRQAATEVQWYRDEN